MECNKDEALRAKGIAEKKFTRKDIAGAMKFALKARNLFPELDGIEQLSATIEVHMAAEKIVNGEPDWYGVLGVDPKADDDSVRRQYRKLALMLHPDKNKAVGGDGAFKLVSQAWSLLSDKARRTTHDQIKGVVPKAPGASSGKTGANGFHHSSAKCTTSGVRSQKAAAGRAAQQPNKPNQNTFWTVCHRCKMQYEYLRMYQNHNLLCPNCHGAFFAVEIAPPNGSKSSSNNKFSQQKGAAQAAQKKAKRERNDAQAAIKREEALRRKNAGNFVTGLSASAQSNAANGKGDVKMDPQKKDMGNGLTDFENKMIKNARMEIHKRLDEAKLASAAKAAGKEDANHKDKASGNDFDKSCDEENQASALVSSVDESNFSELNRENRSSDGEALVTLSVDVPTSDFHDFNAVRTENSYAENQVWAVYDDDDGMPRHYVMIHQVVSLNPFKVKISWLSPKTSSTLGLLNWVTSGFSLTCADFQQGRTGIINLLDSFSHKVRSVTESSGVINIFPRKGDVWAVYRNWSRNWNELTPEEVVHKYEVVEVLDDYDEEQGLTVIPLVKVAGFRALFHQHLDFREIRQIRKEEMTRFSHYVPSFLHLGSEAPSSLRGCRELDPAATPQELLQVIAVETVEEIIEVEEKNETVEEIIEVEEKNEEKSEFQEVKDDEVAPSQEILREELKGGCEELIEGRMEVDGITATVSSPLE